jgi:CheY-like chemotaxis protein
MSAEPPSPPPQNEIEIKSILLVDDDAELADTLKELLESRNFVVAVQPNGVAALREVQAIDYDVIICDMLMPKMAGDMFYLAVKKIKPELAERFIFITGYADTPEVEGFLQSIEALVVFKPALMEELVEMISLVLQRTAAK